MATSWRLSILLLGVLVALGYADPGSGPDEGDEEVEDPGEDALSVEQLKGIHSKFDLNQDGKASLSEVYEYALGIRKDIARKDIATILEEMDTNKDGKLSVQELLADMDQQADGDEEEMKEIQARKDLEVQKFKIADKNGDESLDLDELPALFYPETHEGVLELTAASTLKQKDLDGNGKLSPKEFWEGDMMDREDGGSSISEEEKQDFAKLDKNGDGELELSELKEWESGRFHTGEALQSLFNIADKDKDGHLSAQELTEGRELIAGSDAQYHLMEWVEHNEL